MSGSRGSWMAVLVTRPTPDNEATAEALRVRGFEALLAPMLRFEPVPPKDEAEATYGAVIATSANALRALQTNPIAPQLHDLPLFAVGKHTASAAAEAGFAKVISADGDASQLRDVVTVAARKKQIKKALPLLYLAGADLARDLARDLGDRGFTVITRTTYRMADITRLPRQVCDAFAANGIEAVLHYSRRSVRAFLDAARTAGVEISALAVLQGCISDNVAALLREAGATQLVTARSPDEPALLEALERALRSRPR
jgi:uroporphyrinogen-III synthase